MCRQVWMEKREGWHACWLKEGDGTRPRPAIVPQALPPASCRVYAYNLLLNLSLHAFMLHDQQDSGPAPPCLLALRTSVPHST